MEVVHGEPRILDYMVKSKGSLGSDSCREQAQSLDQLFLKGQREL